MAKMVIGMVKLIVPGGQASPAPPVGTALGPKGVNIMEFVKAFNAKTQDQPGVLIPVELTVYADHSFTFVMKTPPASYLIKQAVKLEKGSSEPNREKVGTISRAQLRQIAKTKMTDLNAHTVEAAMNIIAGTARAMGVLVES